MKKILYSVLALSTLFVSTANINALAVNEADLKEMATVIVDGEPQVNNIYVIGRHVFTNSLTVEEIMIGSRSLADSEENIIYFYNTETKKWANAVNNAEVSTLPNDLNVNFLDLEKVEGVTTLEELKNALANDKISMIRLDADITGITERLVIDRPLTLDGNNHELTFTNAINTASYGSRQGVVVSETEEVEVKNLKITMDANQGTKTWNGIYGLQAYKSTITVENVTVKNADAALFSNDANVSLKGTIDVSNNEFGGIEVSNGSAVLNENDAEIVNTTESFATPTIWTDSEDAKVNLTKAYTTADIRKGQTQYYQVAENSTINDLETLNKALANEVLYKLPLGSDLKDLTSRIVINRPVTLVGNEHTLTFTNAINTATYGERQGLLISATEKVTVENLKITMDANQGTLAWDGVYGLQAHNSTEVTLNNVTVTKADGGLFANNSNVTLVGTIDVSGNEFGGIEVSNGSALLDATDKDLVLVNTTEAYALPTIWTDEVNTNSVNVEVKTSLNKTTKVKENQNQYYLNESNTHEPGAVTNEETLLEALADTTKNEIKLDDNIELTSPLYIEREGVTINGNGKNISYKPNEEYVTPILVMAKDVTIENINMDLTNHEDAQGVVPLSVVDTENVTIKDVKVKSGLVGIHVTNASVKLEGTIDVSGNSIGISLMSENPEEYALDENTTKASGVNMVIDLSKATLVNSTEITSMPTIGALLDENTTITVIENTNQKLHKISDSGVDMYYIEESSSKEPAFTVKTLNEEANIDLNERVTVAPNFKFNEKPKMVLGETGFYLTVTEGNTYIYAKIENITKPVSTANVEIWADEFGTENGKLLYNDEIFKITDGQNGWGASDGFHVKKGDKTQVGLLFNADTIGTYTYDLVIYDAPSAQELARFTKTVEVQPAPTGIQSTAFKSTYYNKYTGQTITSLETEYPYYVNLGKYLGSENPEKLNIETNEYAKDQKGKVSIGNNSFITLPVWKIDSNNNLLVAFPYLVIDALPKGATTLTIGGYSYKLHVYSDLTEKGLTISNTGVVNKKANYTATIESKTVDNKNVVELTSGYHNNMFGITFRDASGKDLLNSNDLILRKKSDGSVGITAPEEGYTYTIYPFGWSNTNKTFSEQTNVEAQYKLAVLGTLEQGIIEFTLKGTGLVENVE